MQWNPDVATQLVVASDEDTSPALRVIICFPLAKTFCLSLVTSLFIFTDVGYAKYNVSSERAYGAYQGCVYLIACFAFFYKILVFALYSVVCDTLSN